MVNHIHGSTNHSSLTTHKLDYAMNKVLSLQNEARDLVTKPLIRRRKDSWKSSLRRWHRWWAPPPESKPRLSV